jgi:hypothetical protein
MKKILLGTSALVLLAGAAAAQQVTTKAPFTVTLGGSIRSDFIIVNDDAANAESREARLDYRLTLKAEAKAENGLTYGFSARLRNNQNGSGQANQDVVGADTKFIYMGGSWGKVELGDTLAVDTNLEVQAPSVGIGQADYAFGPSTGNYSYYHANEGEFHTKVVYYTPVFSGFQAGISYTPEKGSAGRDNARSKFITGSGNNYNDLISLGAAYTGKFSDIGLKVGGGVQFGDAKDTSATVKSTLGDYSVWHLGAQVSYAGFTFGGHYYDNGDTGLAKGTDQIGWQLGLTYVVGPWGVGINYARTETDVKSGKDTTDYVVGIGGAYQLAPGLSLQADIVKFEAESQTTGLKSGQTKNDGTLFTFRTRVDF